MRTLLQAIGATIFGFLFLPIAHAQSHLAPTSELVGWITYDGTAAVADFTHCSSKSIFHIWQSDAEVREVLSRAEKAKVAQYIVGKRVLVHVTIEAKAFTSDPRCKPSAYYKGCVRLVKTIELRKSTTDLQCASGRG